MPVSGTFFNSNQPPTTGQGVVNRSELKETLSKGGTDQAKNVRDQLKSAYDSFAQTNGGDNKNTQLKFEQQVGQEVQIPGDGQFTAQDREQLQNSLRELFPNAASPKDFEAR